MANIVSLETKKAVAAEVANMASTGKNKSQIAKEFDISLRSLNRYVTQFGAELSPEAEKMEQAFEEKVEEPKAEATPAAKEPKEAAGEEKTEKPTKDTPKKAAKEEEDPNYTKLKHRVYYKKLTVTEQVMLDQYYTNKKQNLTEVNKMGNRGRAPEGVKTIRDTIMSVIEDHLFAGTLTKDNRKAVLAEIMEKVGCHEGYANFHFSKLKKLFGANRLK